MSVDEDQSGAQPGQLVVLDRETCLSLLATRPVGRLVFTHRALPEVLPVNYRLRGSKVLIRLAVGSTAARATRDSVVAFQVDDIDIDEHTGWSVTVVGHAHEIAGSDDDGDVLPSLDREPWVGGERDFFLEIEAEKVTGRRLSGVGEAVEGKQAIED